MIVVRRAAERGHADHGWLDTRHTFSFADYYDPSHMGFRDLRVINEDRVTAGQGFGRHSHRDMEIVSWVLEGGLAHSDSIGGGAVLKPGEIQRMSAGTGVVHSEFNASDTEPVHFLQIWILPERAGLTPSYEQKLFPLEERQDQLRRIVSPEGLDGAVRIHQDVTIWTGVFDEGREARLELAEGRHAWVQVARGEFRLGDVALEAGDGAALTAERSLELRATARGSEVLVFDLR